MKRGSTATGVVMLFVNFGALASAAEPNGTQTAKYQGSSWESDCSPPPNGPQPSKDLQVRVCREEKAIHNKMFSPRTAFAVPSSARSVRISIKDDTDRPVSFRVYFDNDAVRDYRFTNSTCAQRATLNLGTATREVSVARMTPGCGGAHTTGTVTATFSSKRTTRPSPRNYVAGCGLSVSPFVGFDGGSCSYTASKPGGYIAVGWWTIDIVRGSTTIHREAVRDPHCSDTGFIKRGDYVTLQFLAGYARAGDDAHC